MKLFTKYNRFSIVATVVIFILASIAFYLVMKLVLTSEVDDALELERKEIELAVAETHHLPKPANFKEQSVSFSKIDKPFTATIFSTVSVADTGENEMNDYRQLQFGITADNGHYLVTVRNSLVETQDLLRSILPIALSTIVLILLTIFIINRLLLKRLWRPFYNTLSRISQFDVSSSKRISFEQTPIEEFAFMNTKLENLTLKVQTEYDILKEFTENASHEMQTPLAIVKSKLDLLANHENLSSAQSRELEGAYDAVQKLSRLNQSLLLLAKIENRQFTIKKPIALHVKVFQKLESLRELFQAKQITVNKELEVVSISMNPELCDILLNNLFSNAIRHNKPQGTVSILLTKDLLTISNSGAASELDKARLFNRFYKGSGQADGTGLGLSIMKEICKMSDLSLDYYFRNGEHAFVIKWQPA